MATALKHFSECVERCDEAGLVRIAVPNRVMMGHCRIYVCDFDAALDDIRKALEMARRIGDSHAEMFALQSSGLCLTVAGRHDETVDIQAAALEQARRLKARRYEAIILAVCGEQAIAAGRPAEALSLVRSGLEASQETSSWFRGADSPWPVGPRGAEPFSSGSRAFRWGDPAAERRRRPQSFLVPALRDRVGALLRGLGVGRTTRRGAPQAHSAGAAPLFALCCAARTTPRSHCPRRRQRQRHKRAFGVALERGRGRASDGRFGRSDARLRPQSVASAAFDRVNPSVGVRPKETSRIDRLKRVLRVRNAAGGR